MFTCKCLNIVINNKNSTNLEKVEIESLNLNETEKNDQFFQQAIGKVVLENIMKEQSSLVNLHTVGNWIVYQCLNCGMFTHAIHKKLGASNVLINLKLLVNANEIAALKKCDQYSTAFRMVILHTEFDFDQSNETQSLRRENGNIALDNLQQQFNEALKIETQNTEERIKAFSEEQFLKLDEFRNRSKQEYKILTRLIQSNQPKLDGSNSEIPISSVDPSNQSSEIEDNSLSNPLSSKYNISYEKSTNVNINKEENKKLSPIKNQQLNTVNSCSYDSEVLFEFDGGDDTFNSQEIPTDDDESDLEDSLTSQNYQNRQRINGAVSIAKSLPINVPAFITNNRPKIVQFEETQEPDESNPTDIAASIKALARSVHGDTIFGDLPRPRFSTQI